MDRRFIFEDHEKEHFCQLVRRVSGFTGLDVVTFCVMGNHIHLLIEQPDPATLPALTKAELLRRARYLYDANTIQDLEQEFQRAEEADAQPWIQQILDRYANRMGGSGKWGQADYFGTTVNYLILLIFSASNRIGSLAPFLRFRKILISPKSQLIFDERDTERQPMKAFFSLSPPAPPQSQQERRLK